MLPAGLAADDWTFDPAPLKALAAGKKITLAYPADRPADQQAAEALQTQLSSTGLEVELVPTQDADAYGWSKDFSSAPNLYYRVPFPDSSHPDTWARLFWYSDLASGFGGFLNFLGSGTKAGDGDMDAGLPAVDDKVVEQKYDAAAKELHDQVGIITLADVPDVFIAKSGITGFAHWLPMPLTLALKALKAG
jgi:peptide/nickel transport system substrate-binding protein